MEKFDISNTSVDWASLVRHVAADQVAVELSDGSVAIAQVVPLKKSVTMKDFASIMSRLPSLSEDASSFAKDVETARQNFRDVTDPWES